MIGPSSSGNTSSTAEAPIKRHQQQHHRTLLDELDIESICDEFCEHHQHPRPQTAKRPRYLADLSPSTVQLLEHEALGLPTDDVFAPYFIEAHQSQVQQMEESGAEAPVAKLEVLVVDGTWDDALHSLQTVSATTQPCNSSILAELTTSLQASEEQQQQQHDITSLHTVDYQNTYWSPTADSHSEQATVQPAIQSTQQQQQHQHQQQRLQTTPKMHHSSDAAGRHNKSCGSFATAPLSAPANYEDQENGNLSWLLDFKLDSLIEAPEDKSTLVPPRDFQGNKNKLNGSIGKSLSSQAESTRKMCTYEVTRCDGSHSPSMPCNSSMDSRKSQTTGPKKPPFTYTELIEHALQERGELTVSAIYQWISERFPYYKSNDDRWKNSVRHNLSINPHFRKGSKAPHGAGHLWAIASQDESKPRQLFNIATIRQALRNEEAAAAAAQADIRPAEPIDEVAAATASISEPLEEEEDIVDSITLEHCAEQILSGIKKEVEVQYLVPMMVSSNGEIIHSQSCQTIGSLTTTATTAMTTVNQVDSLCSLKDAETMQQSLKISLPNFPDFLNPVSKEVVAEECGLLGEGYLVTDLNPTTLGLNMAESEVVSSDNLFGEELSFQFYEFASAASSQLQSA